MDKGPKNRPTAVKLGMVPVFVVFNDDFIEKMGENVKLDQASERAVGRFDKFDRSEVNELFMNRV